MTRHAANDPTDVSPSLADQLRAAARDSGLSVYRLAKEAQVDQSTLNKFLAGDRDNLRLDVADRLFRVLGLRVVRRERPGVED
jgi:plasmid maintenance system antidote protein VapI